MSFQPDIILSWIKDSEICLFFGNVNQTIGNNNLLTKF